MGAVDLVVQVESPPSVAPGLQRVGRAGHQVGAVSTRRHPAEVPRRPRPVRGGRRADGRRRDRGDHLPAQPARRPGPAGRRDVRARLLDGRRPRRRRPPGRAVRRAAAVGARGRARHAVGPLPQRRLRRAAAAHHLGPRHRRAGRPPGRAAARRHQRRHHPRPRHVRRVPRRREGLPRRRARRGDGLREPRRRRLPARLVRLADRGHHPRPRPRHARPRPARPDAVLDRRRPRPPVRARPGARRVPARAVGAHARGRRRRLATAGLDALASDNLLAYLAEQREATGTLPDDRTILVERFRDELGDWRIAVH